MRRSILVKSGTSAARAADAFHMEKVITQTITPRAVFMAGSLCQQGRYAADAWAACTAPPATGLLSRFRGWADCCRPGARRQDKLEAARVREKQAGAVLLQPSAPLLGIVHS